MTTTYPNVQTTNGSPNANAQYFRSNFIPYATILINNKPVSVPDILNTTLLGVINNLTPQSYYTFSTGQQITTQAYNGTGNTSTWWMIAELNGYIHPLQMQGGDIVFIPDPQSAINGTNITNAPPTPSTVSF